MIDISLYGLVIVFLFLSVAHSEPVLEDYFFTDGFEDGTVGAWSSYPPAQDTAYDPTLWIRPLHNETGVPNRALYREITANYELDYTFGVRKKLDMLVGDSSMLKFRCMVKSYNGTEGVRVRFGFADGSMAERMVKFGETGTWRICRIPFSDIVPEGSRKKLDAVAFMAVCPKAEPDVLMVLGLDDVSIDGWRGKAFSFAEPAVHKLEEWPDFIAGKHYIDGETLTIAVTSPVEARKVAARFSRALTGTDEKTVALKRGRDEQWSLNVPLNASSGIGPGFWRVEVHGETDDGDSFSTSLVFLVKRKDAPSGHPRLFFSAEDRARILERASSGHLKHVWERIQSRAADLRSSYDPDTFNYNLDTYDETYWLATFGGYYGAIWVPNGYIRENAVVYALSGSAEAGEAAKRGLLKLAEWPSFVHPHILNQGQFTYWPVAIMLTDLALSYDLVYDTMTPSERRTVADALYEKGITQVFNEYVRDNRVSSNTSNWISDAMSAGILGSVAVTGEYEENSLEPYLTGCILKVAELVDDTFDADGAYGEGALYYSHALHCLTKTMPVLERMYGVRFPDDKIDGSWEFLIHQINPESGRIYDYGDAFENIRLFRPDGYLGLGNTAYLISKYRDPHLRWFYDLNPGETERDLIFLDDSVAPSPPDDLPKVKLFKDAGTAVFRSGFGSDDFMFVFRCGAFYNHHHFDQGSFFLEDRGVEFLTESGRTDYYSDPWYQKLYIQAGGHNCVLVDGNPESQQAGDFLHDVPSWSDRASITDFMSFSGGAFVSGRLDPLYKGKLAKLRRSALYIEPRTVVLIDEAQGADDARQVNLLFHAPTRDAITVDGTSAFIDQGAERLEIRTVVPEHYDPDIMKRPITLNEFNNENPVTMKSRGYLRLTSDLGWAGESTVFVNVISTDTRVFTSLNERVYGGHVAVKLDGTDYFINREEGSVYTHGDLTTDALVCAYKQNSIIACRASMLVQSDTVVFSSDKPVSVEIMNGETARITISAGETTRFTFSRTKKPRRITRDGARIKDWKYDDRSGVTVDIPPGQSILEIN